MNDLASTGGFGSRSGRLGEVDALKGVGILLVVLIHSLRPTWDPGISGTELWLGYVTRFAVPGFFAASGYLYSSKHGIPRDLVRRRLTRLLVPYLVASLAAQVFFLVSSVPPPQGPIWRQLVLGGSFGAYYFVFILVLFIAASPVLARLSTRSIGLLLIPLLVAQFLLETGTIPVTNFFWYLRNPFLWGGYFVLGWWIRLHRTAIVDSLTLRRRSWLVFTGGTWLALVTLLAFSGALPPLAVKTVSWLTIFATLAVCFVASAERQLPESLMGPLRWLSDASYPIYLFHLFFVVSVARMVRMDRGVFEPGVLLVVWGCGVVGPVVLLWSARKLLKGRSRTLLGA